MTVKSTLLSRLWTGKKAVPAQPEEAEVVPVFSPAKPLVILFSDDSTLIFACRLRDTLLQADPDCPIEMAWFRDENALSYRQISQLLPNGPDRILDGKKLSALMGSTKVSAILTSRVYRAMIGRLKNSFARWGSNRPCIISFLGGLDFFPEQGFIRRCRCDGVYLFPENAIEKYRAVTAHLEDGWQDVGFGHPSVLAPQGPPEDLDQRGDIFFYTQAISPLTKRGRMHVLRTIVAIARANPDRKVFIKLRHLPNENAKHLHLERYNYPALMAEIDDLPANLLLTDISMEESLKTAALGITCTSTAALDVVGAGIPCMVYLDYVDSYRDPLMPPMRELFETSNIVTPLSQILALEHNTPDPEWLADMFCERDLGARVLDTITRFHERTFKI